MSQDHVAWKKVAHHKELYLFVIPTLVLIGLFLYYPAASGIFHSFFRWNGSDVSEPVGLGNYIELLRTPAFWQSFRVAFILGLWNVVKMIPAIGVAVLIHRCRSTKMQFLYRGLFVIPMVIPSLIIALIWRLFFFEASTGYLNRFLSTTGLFNFLCWLDQTFGWGGMFTPGVQPAWLGDPRLILTACIIWGFPWVGSFAVLTHIAKLQNIPKDLYEAADLDGVSWWSKFSRIEMPMMMGSIYLMLVFTIIGTVKDASIILALAGLEGGPGGVVTVPALFMLRKAFVSQEMGAACAVGIVLTLVVLALQKVSSAALQWPELSSRQKFWARIGLALAGAAMVVANVMLPVAICLFLLALPLPRLRAKWDAWRERRQAGRAVARKKPAWKPPRQKVSGPVGTWALRGSRHFLIWLVLGSALLPAYLMAVVSLKTNTQFYAKPATLTRPMHWNNWSEAWEMVSPSVANSLFISILGTAFCLVTALAASYFFARKKMPLSGFFWNSLLILMMMPMIANLVPLFRLLVQMGLNNTLTAIILVGTASGQVFAIFVLRNFLADIPRDLFESAEIDGANHFQQMRHVVLPLSGPILGTVGVMHFVNEWNEFVLPLILIRDADRLPVMVQLLRLAGEYVKFWGPLMAGYTLASIPVVVLFLFSMKFFTKGLTEGAVKG